MLIDKMLQQKIVVAIRGVNITQAKNILSALKDGGIQFVEFTFDQRTDDFSSTLKAIEYATAMDGMHVGAGTTLTRKQAKLAIDSGAEYLISPSLEPDVIASAKEFGLLAIPGAFSPTEIALAYKLGADIVKVFPASIVGSAYFKALRAPLPHIPLMAMGGIDNKNMSEYATAGANLFGIGANIVDGKLIAEGNYTAIKECAEIYVKCSKEL